MTLHVNCLKISFQRAFDAVVKKKKKQNLFLLINVCMIVFFFCRAVWGVANGDYVEARAAQAVVVQYPFSN